MTCTARGRIQEAWASDGFEEVGTFVALLSHRVLRVDLELREDRQLKTSETTVLTLVAEGVIDPDTITGRWGCATTAYRFVTAITVDMLARAALWKGRRSWS